MTLTIGSLFSGIGGLELGLERAGLGPVLWQVECDDYAIRVLERHWPDAARYRDVREVGRHNLAPVDVICGGFPCQDVSNAGKRAGLAGHRSGLWSEFARIVRELRPGYVLVENVAALLGRGFGDVLGDLAACGYDAEWDCIPAAAVGAPHRRDRLFLVAYARGVGPGRLADAASWDHAGRSDAGREEETGRPPVRREDGRARALADPAGERRLEGRAESARQQGGSDAAERGDEVADSDRLMRDRRSGAGRWRSEPTDGGRRETESILGREADGLPGGLDAAWGPGWEDGVPRVCGTIQDRVARLRCLGNAVVPQVAEFIGRRIAAHAGVAT
jgi:DNA (cytosine-5)-methyltransferase 1